MADKRGFFTVDTGYFQNPKIAELLDDQPRAVLLHLQCIAYSAQHLTDGVVPLRMAMRLAGAEGADAELLVQRGLLIPLEGGRVEVHDYLEHQRSSQQVKQAAKNGRDAAVSRWKRQPQEEALDLGDSDMRVAMPVALPDPMPRQTVSKTEELQAPQPRKRGSRVPENFAIDDAMRAWAAKSAPDVDIVRATEDFIDYWKSVPGVKGVKLDWVATWRQSMRKQQSWAADRKPSPKAAAGAKGENDWMYR